MVGPAMVEHPKQLYEGGINSAGPSATSGALGVKSRGNIATRNLWWASAAPNTIPPSHARRSPFGNYWGSEQHSF